MKYYVYLGLLFISVGVSGGDFESVEPQAPEQVWQLTQKQIQGFTKKIADTRALVDSLQSEIDDLWFERDTASDRKRYKDKVKEKIQQKRKLEVKIRELERRIENPKPYLIDLKKQKKRRDDDPEYRRKLQERKQRYREDSVFVAGERRSERDRYRNNPVYRQRKIEVLRERRKDPVYRQKQIEAERERMKDPEYKKRRLERNRESSKKKRQRTEPVETPQTPRAQELVDILTNMG
ncbi:MAG TPA: hypothetical protein QGF02_01670 [Candidatus Babeliales bacterium]|nr:hypothetical protein [Candidatus Babeliales bacterium]